MYKIQPSLTNTYQYMFFSNIIILSETINWNIPQLFKHNYNLWKVVYIYDYNYIYFVKKFSSVS